MNNRETAPAPAPHKTRPADRSRVALSDFCERPPQGRCRRSARWTSGLSCAAFFAVTRAGGQAIFASDQEGLVISQNRWGEQ